MGEKATQDVLRGIVDRLVREDQPEKIFLFGSYAYGTPDEGSDLDLLVIKDSSEDRWQRRSEVSSLIAPIKGEIGVDVFALTPSELHLELCRGNQFYQEIVSRGVLLHGRKESYPLVSDSGPYAQSWLSVALEDLQAAEIMLSEGGPSNVAGMLLQQAVQKYLKAFLLLKGWRLKRTHDLVELLDDAAQYAPAFGTYRSVAATVTRYYVDDRYPDTRRNLNPGEVEVSLDAVRPMIAKVLEAFPE